MKNTLYVVVVFLVILMIAISYQLHLMNFTENINLLSDNVIFAIEKEDYKEADTLLTELEKLWDKNYKLLMGFHDHSSVNNASVFMYLAINNYRTKEYNQISDNLINFTSIMNELAAENIPSLENIL